MSTIPVVERLLLIRLVLAALERGIKDKNDPGHFITLRRMEWAGDWELEGLSRHEKESALRHATKNAERILEPFKEGKMDCAKFVLCMFYAINELVDEGSYANDNPHFYRAMATVVGEESNLPEIASIKGVDASAQKQSRKLLNAIRSLGYFPAERVA